MIKKEGRMILRFLMILLLLSGFAILQGAASAVAAENPFFIGTSTHGYFAASAAFDGTNYLVGMEKGVNPADNHDTQVLQFISQSGSLVGSLIESDRRGGMAMVGFNSPNYLVMWPDDIYGTDKHAVYGQVRNTSGDALTEIFAISPETSDNFDTGPVICNSGKCTVFWSKRGSDTTVYGRDISPTGEFLTSAYTIFSNPAKTVGHNSGAACDNDGNCLIAADTGSQIIAVIRGSSISKSSFVIATKAPTGSCTDQNPVGVAFDGTNYLVVWNDHSNCAEVPSWDIIGQRLDASGNLIGSTFKVNSSNTWSAAIPSIAYDGTKFLVAWTDRRNDLNKNGVCDTGERTCDDTYGRFINTSGVPMGTEFVINSDAGNQLGLVMGFNAAKYLVLLDSGTTRGDNGCLTGGSVYGLFVNKAQYLSPNSWGSNKIAALFSNYGSESGIWSNDGSSWNRLSDWQPIQMIGYGTTGIMASFKDYGSGNGLYRYDGSSWGRITDWVPSDMVSYSGGNIAGKFSDYGSGGNGIWRYNGSWTRLTDWVPDGMATLGSDNLAGMFAQYGSGNGVYKHDGSSWSRITDWLPDSISSWGSRLSSIFSSYGSSGNGLWIYDGSWKRATDWTPVNVLAWKADTQLAAIFRNYGANGNGIWNYTGSSWNRLTDWVPTDMTMLGSDCLVAVFKDYGTMGNGVWKYNSSGSSWTRISDWIPETVTSSGDYITAVFNNYGSSGNGIWKYQNGSWTRLTDWLPKEPKP